MVNPSTQFPSGIKFKYPWRAYQKRVLDELETHLDDNHLHIVAPPGSGKTILGLEVALRLNKPVLIFAPTISIRNQWVERFTKLFLQTSHKPDWISYDIKKPKFFTVATYQSLHSACTGVENKEDYDFEEEEIIKENRKRISKVKVDALVKGLAKIKLGTIIVDEAHHLKNAWWQTLIRVKNALKPTIVGLTATPPYDVSYLEWKRYINLSGPVDAEISVPELVVAGDLCPHQDYVFFSSPTVSENESIQKYKARVNKVFQDIQEDKTLIEALRNHPIIVDTKNQLEWIYVHLEYYTATLIFLNAVGIIPSKLHLDVIADKNLKLPPLNYKWLEILLHFYLYEDTSNFKDYEHQEQLLHKLRRNSIIEKRSVNFEQNKSVKKLLNTSISKLDSIKDIVTFESQSLKEDLRMVILTDYIRKEYLIEKSTNDLPLIKIGIMPIFEKIRRDKPKNIQLGVLSGSIVILPIQAKSRFETLLKKQNITSSHSKTLAYDSNYLLIHTNGALKQIIVQIVTQLFEEGEIAILIGTKSLLGEGWDAPAINTLILASFVGSYVLSNQMRGRAIRSQLENKNKTGNIWHLVCKDETANDGGSDLALLERRFKAFVGVSFKENSIENGINRLDSTSFYTSNNKTINKQMFAMAGKRDLLKSQWEEALKKGVYLVEELKVPYPKHQNYESKKRLYSQKTIGYLLATLGSGLATYSETATTLFRKSVGQIRTKLDLMRFLAIAGTGAVVLFGRLTYKSLRSFIKYRDISKDIYQIGQALLASLIKQELIKTPLDELEIKVVIDKQGAMYCHLEGGTTYEKSTFIKALEEIIGLIDNPRYIIIRKSFFVAIIAQKDYHTVPEVLAYKKNVALDFKNNWRNYVGKCELVYTRTIAGRKLLLLSKINALSSQFDNKPERVNKWR